MHVQELVTAAAEGLPIKVLLLDNQCLGMVRAQQDRFYSGTFRGRPRRPARTGRRSPAHVGRHGRARSTSSSPSPARRSCTSRVPDDVECLPMVAPGTATAQMVG